MTKPFAIVTEDAYAEGFAASCTPHPTRRGVLLTGTCPRCGDRMDFPVPTRVFQRPVRAAPDAKEPQPVMCTCEVTHPGTPAGEEGCGAYWNVELSRSAP
jgi:hypothetical protein